jgi:ABC-type bacteriocin/lantibiotic exporter with double-glycine peptidase domain
LHLLIDSFQDTSKGNNFQKTTLIVVSMSSALLLSSFLDFNFNFYVQKMALRIRMIVLLSVYGKLLKVPTVNFSRADITTGRLLNFVSTGFMA